MHLATSIFISCTLSIYYCVMTFWLSDICPNQLCPTTIAPKNFLGFFFAQQTIGGWIFFIYGQVIKFGTSNQCRPKTASPTLLSSFSPHQAIVPNFLTRPYIKKSQPPIVAKKPGKMVGFGFSVAIPTRVWYITLIYRYNLRKGLKREKYFNWKRAFHKEVI